MKPHFPHLLASVLLAFSAAAQPDSVTVIVSAPASMKQVFLMYEPAPYTWEMLSNKQVKRLPIGTFVFNNEADKMVYYFLDRPERLEFVRDATNTYWLAKTGNPRREAELNFEVALRKDLEPFTPIEKRRVVYRSEDAYVADPAKRQTTLQADHEKRLKFLDAYATRHQLRAETVARWQQHLTFHWKDLQLTLHRLKAWPAAYLNQLTLLKADFDVDSLVNLPSYRQAAYRCAQLLAQVRSGEKNPKLDYEAILTSFQGKTRDWLLTSAILEAYDESWGPSNSTPEERATYLARYFTDCQSPEYFEHIRAATTRVTVEVPAGSVLNTQKQPVEFKKITADAPLTYVDFWASWCGPCRAEMPASKKLKAEYEAKGVRFVYVSMDENPVAWEKAAKQIGLDDATSYLLPNPKGNPIVQQFKIGSIPRYLLLGKDGKVLNANAPRPGEAAIRTQLDAALK